MFLLLLVTAMKKVEGIKTRRQAQFIFDRQKKARAIERKKDVKEVQRDLALIRSPAAGLKRPAKDMDIEEDEDQEEDEIDDTTTNNTDEIELDTSINIKAKGGKAKSSTKLKKQKTVKIVEEVESDQEMEAN